MLRQACRDLKAWRDAGLEVTPVSVNLSLIQFQLGHVPERVRQTLSDYNIAPAELTLEITESVFEQHGHALKQDLEAVTLIAVAIGADVVTEGVESVSQVSALSHLGCTKGQGFYYSRAVPEPGWRQLLIDQKAFT